MAVSDQADSVSGFQDLVASAQSDSKVLSLVIAVSSGALRRLRWTQMARCPKPDSSGYSRSERQETMQRRRPPSSFHMLNSSGLRPSSVTLRYWVRRVARACVRRFDVSPTMLECVNALHERLLFTCLVFSSALGFSFDLPPHTPWS